MIYKYVTLDNNNVVIGTQTSSPNPYDNRPDNIIDITDEQEEITIGWYRSHNDQWYPPEDKIK